MLSQKHLKDSERKYVNLVNEQYGFAQRVAGSGCGKWGVCDVVEVRDGQVYLVEIKSTVSDKLNLTQQEVINIEKMLDAVRENQPLKAKLVIHWKRRGWQEIELEELPKLPIPFQG